MRTRSRHRFNISSRERDVIELVAQGCSNREIAELLGIPVETVKSRLRWIYIRTGARNRAHAVALHLTGKAP